MIKKSYVVSPKVFMRNLFTNWSAMIISIVIAFFLTPYIVHHLGLLVYGVWSLINSLIGYMGLFELGTGGGAGRYINHYMVRGDDGEVNNVISTSFVFLTGTAIIIFGVAWLIASNFVIIFPKTPIGLLHDLRAVILLMAFNVWLGFIGSLFNNVLIALDRFDVQNAISIAIATVRGIAIVVVLRQGYGLFGLACVIVAGGAAGVFLAMAAAKVLYRPLDLLLYHVNRRTFLEIWRFGIASFIRSASSKLIYRTDNIVVMIFFGPQMVAIYSIAGTIIQYSQEIINRLGELFYPSIMKAGSLRDMAALEHLFIWCARLSFYAGILLYIGLMVFGGQFISLWMGPGFSAAALILALLSLSELFGIFTGAGGAILFSLDKMRFNVLSGMCEAIANLALSVLFVTLLRMDMAGVALGTLVSMAVIRGFIHPYYTTRVLGFNYARYLTEIGLRVCFLVLAAFVLFDLLARAHCGPGWLPFVSKVTVAACAYLAIGVFFVFKKADIMRFLKLNTILQKIKGTS